MAVTFPQSFGKYTLVRKLATGGMAELFVAKSQGAEGFEREIAIKRILPSFSEDEAFVKMFIDEASLTSKLQHPNIVQIFDFDVIDRQYYIAMEFIEGEDLQGIMKDGTAAQRPLSVAQCVWITIELAKGLHYAHTKEHKGRPLNIIHRDISPHNAMVSYGGEVKLMDFGIAKAAERSTKTQAGTVKGKVAYMSPEQARGKVLDPRSDLFAMAAVLWEMLTHKRLFLRASDFETLTAVLKEDAPEPSKHRQGIDQELNDIIMTALEKDRDHRQATVEVFARELTRWYYKNVTDLEKESLHGYMQTLYAQKIPQTSAGAGKGKPALADAQTVKGKQEPAPKGRAEALAEPIKRRSHPELAAQADAKSLSRTVEASAPEILRAAPPARARQRTVEPPAAKPQDFANSATILDDGAINQADLARALAESRSQKAAAAAAKGDAGRTGSGVKPSALRTPAKSGSKMWLIVTLAVLGIGGAVAAIIVATGP